MYAIVDIAGQQFKVQKDMKIFCHRLENEEGSSVSLDKVLLIDNDGIVVVGAPVVVGASVSAKVVSHLKDDKVKVFKKKRRKGYQKLNGHRQYMTELMIEEILEKGGAKKAAPKATEDNIAEVATAEKKAASSESSVQEEKKAPAKKAAPKAKAEGEKAEPKAATEKPAKASAKAETKKEEPKKEDDAQEEAKSEE